MAGSFAAQLEAFARDSKEKADALVREVVLETGQRVIDRSPIKSGRFKSNWNYGLETRDAHTTEKTDIRALNNLEELPKRAAGFVHLISNALPYGPALERGHSNQAPQGMVALASLEFPQIVNFAVAKVVGRSAAQTFQGGGQ
jgi:hypothetical protein